MDLSNKPKQVNNVHFSQGTFPNIIGFCDRDESSHVNHSDEEAYEYKLHNNVVYLLKKMSSRWELVEFEGGKVVRVSADNTLESVLIRGLSFSEADKTKQEKRVNILFPVNTTDINRAEAIMYYLGGYPKNFLPNVSEINFIKDTF